ncbi:MAG TPA: 4-hydroxy-3-methylbut-2-enyl diphosphate reductase [Ktedonobacterales bacterium]|nr:4-hydroxy-3-methylbut-2-enyl diphosphate reductase [Ktedonobacterales bacterium]
MEVIKVSPRGYCYGVVDAMEIARKAARDPSTPRPIHIVGLIVHNRLAVEELTNLGILTLDGPDRAAILEQVNAGTVIFTAHGVSPLVQERARARGLHVIDATCPDVTRTHDLVRAWVAQGYKVLYIGKKGHPEPEGVVGEAPESVYLIETAADLAAIPTAFASAARLAVTTQTTLSQWDTRELIALIRARYPDVVVQSEICRATQDRQEAVARMAVGADLTIVVGDPRSNNTNRLVQVAEEIAHSHAVRIESVADLTPAMLVGKRRIAVTAGASTPSHITRAVIKFVEDFGRERGSAVSATGPLPGPDAMGGSTPPTPDAEDAPPASSRD